MSIATGLRAIVPAVSNPRSAIFNRAFFHRQTAGDRELERELLTLFDRQCTDVLAALDRLTEPAQRADAAHSLRGAASALGAEEVAARAFDLERASAAGLLVEAETLAAAVAAFRVLATTEE